MATNYGTVLAFYNRFDVGNVKYIASEVAKCLKDHSFAQFCWPNWLMVTR